MRISGPRRNNKFCFFLEGLANEYFTLLLEVCSRLRISDVLIKFNKRLGTSAPDLSHQIYFQSASQNNDESLRKWADRVLVLATCAFPQLPDIHTQTITPFVMMQSMWTPACTPWAET